MNLQEAIEQVADIEILKHAKEVAHINEDQLYHDFVEAIQDGKYKSLEEVERIATEVFKSRNIEFTRHCA